MKTIITLTGVLFVIGLFAFPQAGWTSGKSLVYGRNLERPQIAPSVELEICYFGDPCDDHDDCTDDFCSFKSLMRDAENPRGICQHTTNDHCGGPPLIYKISPPPAPPVESDPPAKIDPPAEAPGIPPIMETPAPVPAKVEPTPESPPTTDLKFVCRAAVEDTVEVDDKPVIFAIDRHGKPTHVLLEATVSANGSPTALVSLLNGAEKIELSQTGGSQLVLVKSSDEEEPDAQAANAVVIDAVAQPGFVPNHFAFDAPIPMAPDRGGVEIYSFSARLTDAQGQTLATASADCPIGLQIEGGGGMGGCSLVDGEFETQQVFGMFGIFVVAWGALCLAERRRRSK